MNLLKRLFNYLNVCGIECADQGAFELTSEYPISIASRYSARCVTLSGEPRVLIEPKCATAPEELITAIRQIAENHRPVVVLDFADLEYSNYLQKSDIDYVVPGRQIYIPPSAVLTPPEAYVRCEKEFLRDYLSPWAQVVFLRALLFHAGEEKISYAAFRDELSIKDVYLTRSCQELEYHQLATLGKDGRNRFLLLPRDRRLLWRLAEKFLRSPILKTIRYTGDVKSGLTAGYSALVALSDLVPEEENVLAISQTEAKRFNDGKIQKYSGTQVEIWRYDPRLLSRDERVDPLSLYLSLKSSPDARIQIALNDLLEKVL